MYAVATRRGLQGIGQIAHLRRPVSFFMRRGMRGVGDAASILSNEASWANNPYLQSPAYLAQEAKEFQNECTVDPGSPACLTAIATGDISMGTNLVLDTQLNLKNWCQQSVTNNGIWQTPLDDVNCDGGTPKAPLMVQAITNAVPVAPAPAPPQNYQAPPPPPPQKYQAPPPPTAPPSVPTASANYQATPPPTTAAPPIPPPPTNPGLLSIWIAQHIQQLVSEAQPPNTQGQAVITPPAATQPPAGQPLSIALTNLSRPGKSFQVGDLFQLVITGPANAPVADTATQNGASLGTTPTGTTDASGRFTTSGTFQPEHAGAWVEQWTVGNQKLSILSFNVAAVNSATNSNGVQPAASTDATPVSGSVTLPVVGAVSLGTLAIAGLGLAAAFFAFGGSK